MIIAIATNKGGVGKTSISLSLGSYLARIGKKTLLVDLDGQCNLTSILYPDYQDLDPIDTVAAMIDDDQQPAVYDIKGVKNLSFIPSHENLDEADSILTTVIAKEQALKRFLEPIKNDFDYIIIDTPPNLTDLPFTGYVAADYIIVPFEATKFSLNGIQRILKKMKKARVKCNSNVKLLGFLHNKYDHRKTATKAVWDLMIKDYGKFPNNGYVFDTKIPVEETMNTAQTYGADIFNYAPRSSIALAFKTWIDSEIIPFIESNNG